MNHFLLVSKNLERTKDFYCRVLGFELADKAEANIGNCLSAWTLPHWMMALAAAGRHGAAYSMLECLKDDAAPAVREVALPACQAVLAHRRGEHASAAALMTSLLPRLQELGGSHAQRDVLAQLLRDSARRASGQSLTAA